MKIRCGCATDIGSGREVNQDAVFLRQIRQGMCELALCGVCDGVGGLERGDVASSLIVQRMGEWMDRLESWVDLATIDSALLFSHMKDASESWNEEVYTLGRQKNLKTGSTMSLLMIVRDRYYIIQVGDSRVYRFRAGLEQLTVDACVTRMKNGKMKNYLSNYMGRDEDLWFQLLEGKVKEGDLFLVCSDGFYHHLNEKDIAGLLREKKRDLGEAGKQMILNMIERGERDNISVGILSVEQSRKRLFGG